MAFPSSCRNTLGISNSVFLATSKMIAAAHPHLLPPTVCAHHYRGGFLLPMERIGPIVLPEDTQKSKKTPLEPTGRKPGYLANSQSQAQCFISKSHCDRLFRHNGTTPDRAKHQFTELCVIFTVMTYESGAIFMSSLSWQAIKEDRAT